MKLKLLKDFILIEEAKEEFSSVLVIPDGVDVRPTIIGSIVEAGPGVKGVKLKDKVLFKRYGFDEVEIKGKKYLLGKEESIFGIL